MRTHLRSHCFHCCSTIVVAKADIVGSTLLTGSEALDADDRDDRLEARGWAGSRSRLRSVVPGAATVLLATGSGGQPRAFAITTRMQ